MGILDTLFVSSKNSLQECLVKGAKIIDVRSSSEYQSGHVKGSLNIPLNMIESHESELKKMKVKIIFCCASGNRSGQATKKMKEKGIDCINGGSWLNLNSLS